MKVAHLAPIPLLVMTMFSQLASGQDTTMVNAIQDNLYSTTGADMPYGERLAVAISNLPSHIEAINLEEDDRNRLIAWAQQADGIQQNTTAENERYMEYFCQQLDSPFPGDIAELLDGFVTIKAQQSNELIASLEQAYEEMSEEGKLSVEAYIESNLLNGILLVNLDHYALLGDVGGDQMTNYFRSVCAFTQAYSADEINRMVQEKIGNDGSNQQHVIQEGSIGGFIEGQ